MNELDRIFQLQEGGEFEALALSVFRRQAEQCAPYREYTCPTIINTFMEAYDLKGKTVITFATSGGSSINKACKDLKAAYPDVNWKEGKLLNRTSKKDLEDWVKQ